MSRKTASLVRSLPRYFQVHLSPLRHDLIHPRARSPRVVNETMRWQVGELLVEGILCGPATKRVGAGVLVHSESGASVRAMIPTCQALAQEGYWAMAVDYQRIRSGRPVSTRFPWRSETDATAALEKFLSLPQVQAERAATLGFSRGATFSLLAAAAASLVKAVVAYYPVTDLVDWLAPGARPFPFSLIVSLVRRRLARELEAQSGEDLDAWLRRASPLHQAWRLQTPVLLIHGVLDLNVPVSHSRKLHAALLRQGRAAQFLEITGAGHVFNFRQPALAQMAWRETMAFLRTHLGSREEI